VLGEIEIQRTLSADYAGRQAATRLTAEPSARTANALAAGKRGQGPLGHTPQNEQRNRVEDMLAGCLRAVMASSTVPTSPASLQPGAIKTYEATRGYPMS